MARENEAKLIGRIKSIMKDDDNRIAQIELMVIRRNGSRIDIPTLLFFGEYYDMVRDLKDDDFMIAKGFIATMQVTHNVVCPNCHKKIDSFNITITKVLGIYAQKIEGTYSLNDFMEVSNSIFLLGPLCCNVRTKEFYSGDLNAQYRMAIGRKVKIEGQESITTDFPFITSFGQQAEQDAKRMTEGSTCFINGALQTRQIIKKYNCECGEEFTETQNITEVTPYNVEYLFNCRFDEED